MESFPNHGFVATGSELDIDMLAADAHFGYYRERTFVQRLHEDIILPARQQGYQHIWLLGLSMGGFGAVLYCNEHPQIDRKSTRLNSSNVAIAYDVFCLQKKKNIYSIS